MRRTFFLGNAENSWAWPRWQYPQSCLSLNRQSKRHVAGRLRRPFALKKPRSRTGSESTALSAVSTHCACRKLAVFPFLGTFEAWLVTCTNQPGQLLHTATTLAFFTWLIMNHRLSMYEGLIATCVPAQVLLAREQHGCRCLADVTLTLMGRSFPPPIPHCTVSP